MKLSSQVIEKILLLTAFSAVSILALITFFIFNEGLPLIFKAGLFKFIFGKIWDPSHHIFSILPMILGSIYVTAGALALGVPLALSCAIFLTEFSSPRISAILKPTIELLAGIPSVIYGFIGVIILTPLIRTYLGGPGSSILAASIVLSVMILPTVISISIDAILAVPKSYKEGSLALGANLWQTVRMVILPAARSGILAGVILGMGRAVGETMAVIMVAGNALKIPTSVLDPVRTLTSNIALELGYAVGDHRMALFATGVVLFIFVMLLNILARVVVKHE